MKAFLALVGIVGIAFVTPAFAQSGSIGLYTDTSGSTCSFSGNDPGFIKAYVVVRPGPDGFRSVAFSAPVPSCLGSIFLGDEPSFGLAMVGDSQTGTIMTAGSCTSGLLHVLTINYFRSGSTTPCCEYPILPLAGESAITGTNCANQDITLASSISHFNADATCACTGGYFPSAPFNPVPSHQAASVSMFTPLSWTASDNDNDLADYDVYLGTDTSPPLAATHLIQTTFQPAQLDPLTQYFWRVVVRDALGHETSGPVWTFTTRAVNSPPDAPSNPIPADGGVVTADNPTLRWQASDIDNDVMTYDLYFGAATTPPLLASGLTAKNYEVQSLQIGPTYYWKVVIHASSGHETTGAVWSFSRQPSPHVLLYGPEPKKGGADVPINVTLTWHVDNTYPFPLTYDVYFGDFGNPNLVPVATNLVTPSYTRPGGYQAGRDYNWFVVAHGNGLTAYGPPWSFYTGPSQTNTPSNPSPPYLGTTSLMPTLSWSVVNPNGHPLTYEVHFGTLTGEFPLPTVATVSQPSYQPGPLEPGRRYYWRITACDESLCSIGPEWTFVAEGALPVLFASFNAAVLGDAIRVAWELTADENLREYALLRRQKGTTSWNTVVELPLDGLSGTFLDRGAARGKSYEYMMLIRTTGDDQFSSPIVGVDLPGLELMLGRNHPNPFNPQTVIPYDIPASSRVRVAIYDPSGRLVRVLVDEEQKAGMHEVSWNGRDDAGRTASSGVYFCVLESGKERRTQKLVLLK